MYKQIIRLLCTRRGPKLPSANLKGVIRDPKLKYFLVSLVATQKIGKTTKYINFKTGICLNLFNIKRCYYLSNLVCSQTISLQPTKIGYVVSNFNMINVKKNNWSWNLSSLSKNEFHPDKKLPTVSQYLAMSFCEFAYKITYFSYITNYFPINLNKFIIYNSIYYYYYYQRLYVVSASCSNVCMQVISI
eukprot:TRINITY_DN19750_c0_g1_i3.p1 TRINITY_DN19750_c0_g1~~TRINITY_DN19750_c0_g1_i3.p1  ORF type:complete len:189 (-),score=-17.22 TRINITY_DN19750_c0_g1_i3:370-936(-)